MAQDTSSSPAPRHIAIIMDGNGRWAQSRGLPRTAGHQQGIEAAKRTVRSAITLEIPYITLFGFSAENWSRPQDEVMELMRLLRIYLRSETAELAKAGVRLRVIGNRKGLAKDIIDLIENAERVTKSNTKLNLTIALNYGGRQEMVHAVYRLISEYQGQVLDEAEIQEKLPAFLMTQEIPDPDLMIRTSGEKRISNFLLWQSAYTELFFTHTLWPDFGQADMEQAIEDYKGRTRRFGGIIAKHTQMA